MWNSCEIFRFGCVDFSCVPCDCCSIISLLLCLHVWHSPFQQILLRVLRWAPSPTLPHKLLMWPPCCSVLTNGMHNDWSLLRWLYYYSLSLVISEQHAPLLMLKVLFSSFTLSLSFNLWRKRGGCSHSLFTLNIQLAEVLPWLAAEKLLFGCGPLYHWCSHQNRKCECVCVCVF